MGGGGGVVSANNTTFVILNTEDLRQEVEVIRVYSSANVIKLVFILGRSY